MAAKDARARTAGAKEAEKRRITWYYDYSSPYTYLASTRLESLCERNGYAILWRPVLVGGIFNAVNQSVYEARGTPAKARYGAKDVTDWARYYGIPFKFPSIFPVNSVKALRGALMAIEAGLISPYSHRVFRAYWAEDRDIADDAVLRGIAEEAGLEGEAFSDWTRSPAAKEALRAITQEGMDRGVFGSPTFFIGEDMYFGNDRLVLLEEAMRAVRGAGEVQRASTLST
jgi:2-hydroxychromene-2-carboxylate isomerase